MKEFSIEGHDGAAKTPIAEQVKEKLQHLGLAVELYAPFHIVKDKIPEKDIYFYWGDNEKTKQAISLLSEIVNSLRKNAIQRGVDIILYDRLWLTIMVEINTRPELSELWTIFSPTFFITCPPEKTINSKRFSFQVPWTSSKEQVQDYYDRYNEVAQKYSKYIIEQYRVEAREQSLEPIVDSIVSHIMKAEDNTITNDRY